ncbi:MAG: aminotransferase class I/II-fold pyridoxal phosphate-dependent enzyme [Planctomycetota bacterium]|nr:MAG: aminotransferase class I/II-fold pyridoxal phosphate-dependent enzyme [Planctomycetota bacterium]
MSNRPDDICARPERTASGGSDPLAAPLCPSTVYRCESPDHAEQLLTGQIEGYVYSRYGHPNQLQLAGKCAELHEGERAFLTGAGMAGLALALVALLETGDHLVIGRELYGRSLQLFTKEAARLGIDCTLVDANDLEEVKQAVGDRTRLLVVETISNPMLRVADIAALAEVAHAAGARLLVDNTFASPVVCRPLAHGADFVMESITKIVNGHGDVMLGMLVAREADFDRIHMAQATWGFVASPWECWLAARGLGTLALRVERAGTNAQAVAEMLAAQPGVTTVRYPGLDDHPDRDLVRELLLGGGYMVTFTLSGGRAAAERFIAATPAIPFYPSLGDICTTLSHPASTSHVGLTPQERERLDIDDGTIRLSIGIESPEHILAAVEAGLAATG